MNGLSALFPLLSGPLKKTLSHFEGFQARKKSALFMTEKEKVQFYIDFPAQIPDLFPKIEKFVTMMRQ